MFIDRRRDRPMGHLEWRVRLMGVGAILAILGMYFDAGWMIWLAIAVLLLGFFLRFLPEDGDRETHEEDGEGAPHEEDGQRRGPSP